MNGNERHHGVFLLILIITLFFCACKSDNDNNTMSPADDLEVTAHAETETDNTETETTPEISDESSDSGIGEADVSTPMPEGSTSVMHCAKEIILGSPADVTIDSLKTKKGNQFTGQETVKLDIIDENGNVLNTIYNKKYNFSQNTSITIAIPAQLLPAGNHTVQATISGMDYILGSPATISVTTGAPESMILENKALYNGRMNTLKFALIDVNGNLLPDTEMPLTINAAVYDKGRIDERYSLNGTDIIETVTIPLNTKSNEDGNILFDFFIPHSVDVGDGIALYFERDGERLCPAVVFDTGVFKGGMGTPESPYIITDELGFRRMSICSSAHYKLVADISLSQDEFMPSFTRNDPFTGQFDGSGFTVSGLIQQEYSEYGGVFGAISDAVVKDVNFTDVNFNIDTSGRAPCVVGVIAGAAQNSSFNNINISGSANVNTNFGSVVYGGLVGNAKSCIVNICYTKLQTEITTKRDLYAGNLLGYAENCVISECVTFGSLDITANGEESNTVVVGGAIGDMFAGSLADSYTNTPVTCKVDTAYNAGMIGRLYGGLLENCYACGKVAVSNNSKRGGLIAYSYDTPMITRCYYDTQTTGRYDDEGNGKKKITEELVDPFTLFGWDMTRVWMLENGYYPYLRNIPFAKVRAVYVPLPDPEEEEEEPPSPDEETLSEEQ